MSILAELSIFPIGKGEHLSNHVTKAITVIKDSGLPFKVGPMGTTLEGDTDTVFKVVQECISVLENENSRLYMTLKCDITKGNENRIERKVKSVLEKL